MANLTGDWYKLLVNKPEIWELTYANINANAGATTRGIDGVTANGHSMERNHEIMNNCETAFIVPSQHAGYTFPRAMGRNGL